MNGHAATQARYVKRAEEDDINRQLSLVRADHQSRVVLLYGPGGVGKTSLIRKMARDSSADRTVWLEPIDVDDPECWLLSNLESKVADKLDRENDYFWEYRDRLSRLPRSTHLDISHETIVSYLGRLQAVFAASYRKFVTETKKTVVIAFDTVETIRGTNLLLTLTQWMKALPTNTLFVLSGRPLAGDHDGPDQIVAELGSPYQSIPVTTIKVGGFSRDGAHTYIQNTGISDDLIGEEQDKLVLLSRGHPLWLAFMIDYLTAEGVPPEATRNDLPFLEQNLPYDREMTPAGERLHEAFLRRLVAPYRDADFWHEAIKRLAVVRQPVAQTVWQQLMSDRRLPSAVGSMAEAWDELLNTPWIRPRGNRRYVTLHDAVAEEFAKRLFPLHDKDQGWRHGVWRQSYQIYDALATERAVIVEPALAALDAELRRFDSAKPPAERPPAAASIERSLMDQSVQLDKDKRELDQLRAASLYYLFLTDYDQGSVQLLAYFGEAEQQHDSFFQDLLILYLERFLPGGSHSEAFNDVIKAKLDEFRRWLENDRPEIYIALGIVVAKYLVDASQAEDALKLLARLPQEAADFRQLHELYLLRGNACLRAPGMVNDGENFFAQAIHHAEALTTADRHKYVAEAYKERGFYYRNTGQWAAASLSYQHAWETILKARSTDGRTADRREMASVQTNWAYVKGLSGSYRDALELVQSAITIRHQMQEHDDEGMSWSVCGEVYRYARRFEKAWEAYGEAEKLLQARRYWGRLGFIYQEQAICLYQAALDGITITPDPAREAEDRIAMALDLCLAHSIRGYPSALNRAGRITAGKNPDLGLKYLEDGINEAQKIFDGWFWFANLVEFAELSYRQWRRTRRPEYRTNITEKSDQLNQVAEDYSFSDLRGRWSLLQAHLAVSDYIDAVAAGQAGDVTKLDGALEHYESGFVNIAQRHVGSSGTASLKGEFMIFQSILDQLPENVQTAWQAKLRSAWAATSDVSMVLLARLEELYRPAG